MKRLLFVFMLISVMNAANCQTDDFEDIEDLIEDANFSPEEIEEGQAYNFDEHFDSLHIEKLKLGKTKLDSAEWKKLVGDMDFSKKPKPIEQKLKEKKPFSIPKPTSFLGLGQVLLILLIIIVLIGIIILISRQIRKQDVRINEDDVWWQIDLEKSETAETIITSRLQDALRNGEYAIAIRLHYLQALNDLNRKGLILWKKDKTNADYFKELKSGPFQLDFRQLTRWFERAWFGKKATGIETYTAFHKAFEIFIFRLERESNKPKEA
jgi:cell division protein FtsL